MSSITPSCRAGGTPRVGLSTFDLAFAIDRRVHGGAIPALGILDEHRESLECAAGVLPRSSLGVAGSNHDRRERSHGLGVLMSAQAGLLRRRGYPDRWPAEPGCRVCPHVRSITV